MVTYQAAGAMQAVEVSSYHGAEATVVTDISQDGFVLASLLATPETTKATLMLALRIYDEVRRPVAQQVQRHSLLTGQTLFLDRMEGVTVENSAAGFIPEARILQQGEEVRQLYEWTCTTSALPDRNKALAMFRARLQAMAKAGRQNRFTVSLEVPSSRM